MAKLCLHPHPTRALRCELERDHDGDKHWWLPPDSDVPVEWPNDRAKPKPRRPRAAPMARGKGPRKESEPHKLLNAKWAGIKEAFIFLMARYDPEGPHCEECGVPGNARTLDLDHLRPKGSGGEWSARNAGLKCNRFNVHGPQNCHDRKHGVPEWSGKEAS